MQPTLHLVKRKKLKLGLEIPRAANKLAKSVGACKWDGKEKKWIYPPDPNVIRFMMEKIPSLRFTAEVNDWLQGLKQIQETVIASTKDQRPVSEKSLWSFQNGSVRFLTESKRCILGHEMGTGKTVIGVTACEFEGISKILVVCPDHLKWTWEEHFKKWGRFSAEEITVVESHRIKKGSDIECTVIQGNTQDREEPLLRALHQHKSPIIMNYDQFLLHSKLLQNFPYDVVIFDEAHRLKNRKAKRTQAMFKVSQNTDYLWFLTGTPVRKCYTDIWPLLHAIDSERFSSYWDFVFLYTEAMEGFYGGIEILGLKDKQTFQSMLSCYMFRKTKEEVMPDLPPKIYQDIQVQLTGEQKTTYNKMEKEFIAEIKKQMEDGTELNDILRAPNTVAQITRLRQICLHPHIIGAKGKSSKLTALEEIIDDIGDQLLIFTWYKSFIPFVGSTLEDMQIPYRSIYGSVTSSDKRQFEQEFNNDEIQIIVGTIGAMGEGLNLQKSKYSIFTDIDWVPANNEQAEDRIHRGEIKESPTIIRLYHPNTIETDIRYSNKQKQKVVNDTVGQVEAVRNMLNRR